MSNFVFTNQFYNDEAGRTLPKSRLYFYETGTFNTAAVYSDPELTAQLSQPVTADGAGRFPQIFLDTSTVYRVWLKDREDKPVTPFVDDYSPSVSTGDLDTVFGTAAFLDVGTAPENIPQNSDLGSASLVDTGTDSGEVPLNSDLGTAAFDNKTSPSAVLWDSGNLDYTEFPSVGLENIMIGRVVGRSNSLAYLELDTNFLGVRANNISVISTFKIMSTGSTGTDTPVVSGIEGSDMSLNSTRSDKITRVLLQNLSGITPNEVYSLFTETNTSKITLS